MKSSTKVAMGSRLDANSSAVRKKIEQHKFDNEEGEEYGASGFGGFTDYFRRKKIKLQNLDAERRLRNADKPQIFHAVVAHVNGYTQPSLQDLHNLIVDYGGGFMSYLDGKTTVTHIIASNLTPKKKVEFKRYRIVKPAWVVDSIAAGKLLPWDAYRVVDEGVKQDVLGFQNGAITSQASSRYAGYRDQTDTSWYTSQVKGVANQLDSKEKIDSHSPESQADGKRDVPAPKELNHRTDAHMGMDLDVINSDEYEAEFRQTSSARYSQKVEDPVDPIDDESTGPGNDPDSPEAEDDCGSHDAPSFASPARNTDAISPSKTGLTPEEHNAALLADPKIWKSTVVNPGFLKQYYEESRLHHLSTWKANLKSQLQVLAQDKSSSQKARQRIPKGARRYILHVDFDSFFAAVSLKKHPEWVEKPTVVAHGGGSGSEIASCNYPARKFGVKNGMWMKTAQQLCPELKILPYDFKGYEEASKDFYETIIDTGGIVHSVSIDEALLDMSFACIQAGGRDGKALSEDIIYREQAKAEEIAQGLQVAVKEKTGCAVSVGIGGNILLAKLALRKAKPAGQYQIKPEDSLEFIGELTVQDLPGVAYSIGGKLEDIGVKFIKDVRDLSKEKLITTLGPKTGEKIWEYARGIDRAEIGDQVVRKSVSAEVNWGIRFALQDQADEFVRSLCEELHKRLLNERVRGRQITMKIMRRAADAPLDPPKHLGHGKCDVFNKSLMLGVSTNDKDILAREALSIMKGFGFPPGELRGIGVQMTKLEPMKSDNLPESSQRRLQFKIPEPKPLGEKPQSDEILDSPRKPAKVVMHPAATFGQATSAGDDSLLNLAGTQFVLPSQVDPSVLAELPDDIKAKFRSTVPSGKHDPRQSALDFKSRPVSPIRRTTGSEIPPQSQLDPDILAALPEDVREEVLSVYRKPQPPPKQARPPSSPHKPRTKYPPKAPVTPTKKRTTNLLSRTRGPKADPRNTLAQSSFLSRPSASTTANDDDPEISPEFLAAIPEDMRTEVLAQQRQSRLQKCSGLALPPKPKQRGQPLPMPAVQRQLRLPPRAPRPTFTAKRLSSLPELREAVGAWVEAFQGEEPDEEDVGTLVTYLKKVVQVERDMAKAAGVIKWLMWLMENMDKDQHRLWGRAAERLKAGVREAVTERGLGDLNL